MCQQIIQFCSGSTKPLLIVGSLLTFLLAIAIAYLGCTTNALYSDIDATLAQNRALGYHLQLAASAYLVLVTLLGGYAAHFNQKHSVRALAVVSAINTVLALAAIAMVPSRSEIDLLVRPKLVPIATEYDFKDKRQPNVTGTQTPPEKASLQGSDPMTQLQVANSTVSAGGGGGGGESPRPKRAATGGLGDGPPAQVDAAQATRIWDSLQARGCCGFTNSSDIWKGKLPKSCCAKPEIVNDEQICKQVDSDHQPGCLELISGVTSTNLLIVLALVALANLYMAAISGVCAYRTFHYNEASQSAYN